MQTVKKQGQGSAKGIDREIDKKQSERKREGERERKRVLKKWQLGHIHHPGVELGGDKMALQ